MHIFSSKKKLMLSKIFYKIKNKNFFKKNLYLSQASLYNYFRDSSKHSYKELFSTRKAANPLIIEGIFSKSNLFNYKGHLQYSKTRLFRKKSPNINQNKFKPGYQRI
jgi:hypothetical protein